MLRLNENERPQTVAEIRKHFEVPARENRRLNQALRPPARSPRTLRIPWKPIAAVVLALLLIGGGLYLGMPFFEQQKPSRFTEVPKIDPPKPAHPASVNELSHLTNSLHAAGFDRTKLDSFQKECGPQCPADLDAEFKRRMGLLDQEKQRFDGARDNADDLEAYVQSCDVCEFKETAEQRLSDAYAKSSRAPDSTVPNSTNFCGPARCIAPWNRRRPRGPGSTSSPPRICNIKTPWPVPPS